MAVSVSVLEKEQNAVVNDRALIHRYVCLENTMRIQGLDPPKKASNGSQ